jgi:urea transport system permease protein
MLMAGFLKGRLGGGVQVLIIGCVLAAIAFGTGGRSGIGQATTWMVFGLFAVSVDLLWGYCGLMSFGQAGFFGLGAFCFTWIGTDQLGIRLSSNASIVGILLAIAAPALLAFLLGYFLFYGKIVGAYFTIVTFAFSFLLQSLGEGWTKVFGGFTGIPNVPKLTVDLGFTVLSAGGIYVMYAVVTVVTAIVVVLLRWLLSTPFGLAVDGVRDNEDRLAYLGSRTVKTKLIVFTISSAVAGLAGALYAAQMNYVGYHILGTLLSTEVVIWVAVGGRRTLVGGVLGAIVVSGMGYYLSGIAVTYWNLFLGILFILMVLVGSSGVVGLGSWLWRRGIKAVTRREDGIAVGNE